MIPLSDSQQKRRQQKADRIKTEVARTMPRSKLKVKLPGIVKKLAKLPGIIKKTPKKQKVRGVKCWVKFRLKSLATLTSIRKQGRM